jgi:hypothetical protein
VVDIVAGEGRVRGCEEVTPRSGDQGCDNADEIVVHVSRVAQGLRARRDDSRSLQSASAIELRHASARQTS